MTELAAPLATAGSARFAAPPPVALAFDRAAVPSAATRAHAEWRAFADLAEIGDAWRALALRALDPNVFYEPAFALPAAAVFGRGVGAVLVWSGEMNDRLIGFFPARIDRRRCGPLLPLLAGWIHPFAPLGTPLVDREQAAAAIGAWLDCVAAHADLPRLMLLPMLPAEGAFAHTLRAALTLRGGVMATLSERRRALLAPPGDRSGYIAAVVSPKKRKELARQRRRLGGDAEIAFTLVTRPSELPAALADFLALEAAGWKGRAHTAAAQTDALRGFIEQAAQALAEHSQIAVARLSAAGRTLAAAIVLRSGDTAWFWKIAYDESAARGSPGVQIALDLTQAMLADGALRAVDLCAVPDHPMIDHLWRERLALADHIIAVGPAARRALPIACAVERARTAAVAAAKWTRRRLRGR